MPSIIGSIQIMNVSSGIVNFGDTLNISPKTNTKSNHGSGSANIGAVIVTNNALSSTGTLDKDVLDQANTANQ
ncbi:MAG: spore germination protein [Caldibacillus debilis]|jgi:spore germination protein PF|uniref:Spore germination protein gerPA/gerPF n=2 Tax=Caldibacillus debilis TaxID=301148 RepID=A0A420VD43_9BACI|nr:spore germination protein [Caldibacillus debilis]MBO2481019.1 spore germination protein [Bacillaceae bacterium]KYD10593.1 hypothetical protein B4135_3394 [Caldibacillus debilis]MBY6273438.1 spore germination protein [Bacillaceae bacterium]OUM91025.1 MAG: hypothetical protein BAA03_09865 [Caldibacillus debilis]REJ15080.1 MAG: spore germination protein [Caldibacillus debilis]